MDAIATCQALLQQNGERSQSFLDTRLGEDNRSVQNSHPKTNSCTKEPEKTTIPHGILALNAILLHQNTMKGDRSITKNSHTEYHSLTPR